MNEIKHDFTKKSEFYYDLPEDLIAQTPLKKRDDSRLMIMEKSSGKLTHDHFYNIADYLQEGDCLILNDSKVLPARIFGKDVDTGKIAEFLLLKQHGTGIWECLVKPGKKVKKDFSFIFEGTDGVVLKATVKDILEDGNRIIEFEDKTDFFAKLEKVGQMPLPPYIKEKLKDQSRYQTIYAKDLGSAAAPTAGLHFTPEVFEKLKQKGVNIGYVTLHVGLGTFRPVKEENIANHKMHSEFFQMPKETEELIKKTKAAGKRVICVGTTSCRVLESVYSKFGEAKACEMSTDIFIKPGYKFGIMDGLITNFHLPESTLIILVCAFAGYENTLGAYKEAVKEKYRFFSFGDAMMIL